MRAILLTAALLILATPAFAKGTVIDCNREGCFARPAVHEERRQRYHKPRGETRYAKRQQRRPVSAAASYQGTASHGLVAQAEAHVGRTAGELGLRRTAWCSAFLRKITGRNDVNDLARSWLSRPHTAPQIGAIAVLSRGRGGHVGVVKGFDAHGNPILISGNFGRRVGVGVYPARRVLAYVLA